MKILYMNQGGGGDWGALKYSEYDLLLLAEGSVVKQGFEEKYNSGTQPAMQIQVADESARIISKPTDLDSGVKEVRPMVIFQLTRDGVYVVFVHLKSGNVGFASKALETAVATVKANLDKRTPILWIGDFNRADVGVLQLAFNGCTELISGGGQAKWDLDKAVTTGLWTKAISAEVKSKSSDHGHIAIAVKVNEQ